MQIIHISLTSFVYISNTHSRGLIVQQTLCYVNVKHVPILTSFSWLPRWWIPRQWEDCTFTTGCTCSAWSRTYKKWWVINMIIYSRVCAFEGEYGLYYTGSAIRNNEKGVFRFYSPSHHLLFINIWSSCTISLISYICYLLCSFCSFIVYPVVIVLCVTFYSFNPCGPTPIYSTHTVVVLH